MQPVCQAPEQLTWKELHDLIRGTAAYRRAQFVKETKKVNDPKFEAQLQKLQVRVGKLFAQFQNENYSYPSALRLLTECKAYLSHTELVSDFRSQNSKSGLSFEFEAASDVFNSLCQKVNDAQNREETTYVDRLRILEQEVATFKTLENQKTTISNNSPEAKTLDYQIEISKLVIARLNAILAKQEK